MSDLDCICLCMGSCGRLAAIAFGGQNRAKSQRTVHQAEHHADMTTRCWPWIDNSHMDSVWLYIVVSYLDVYVYVLLCFGRYEFGIAHTGSCSTMLLDRWLRGQAWLDLVLQKKQRSSLSADTKRKLGILK